MKGLLSEMVKPHCEDCGKHRGSNPCCCEKERHRAWKARTWLIDWHKHIDRPDRPTRFHYWPIRIGWQRNGGHSLICWHCWPVDGSSIWPDATYKDCGWTIHIGALKIKFGKENGPKYTKTWTSPN